MRLDTLVNLLIDHRLADIRIYIDGCSGTVGRNYNALEI